MIIQLKKNRNRAARIKQIIKENLRNFKLNFINNSVHLETDDKEKLSYILPLIEGLPCVEKVEMDIRETCPLTAGKPGTKKTENFTVIAGPCAIENERVYLSIIKKLSKIGISDFRASLFKPRKSPYTFHGLGKDGVKILKKAKKRFSGNFVTEILSSGDIETMFDVCDIFQVGARNMRNYSLLKSLSGVKKPVLLKRAAGSSLEEWLLSAEYLAKGGHSDIILCERGNYYAYGSSGGIDLNMALKAKKISGLKVLVDISHSSGGREYVEPMALACAVSGVDGIMVETHEKPENALVDGKHSLNIKQFKEMLAKINLLRNCLKKCR